MREGSYNIPRQFKIDKGMPTEALFSKIENPKCRKIFNSEIERVIWSYHMTDSSDWSDMMSLLRQQGLSVFEVALRRKISSELLTEVFAGLLQRPVVLCYLCEDELAMGTFIPTGGEGTRGRSCTTDFYPYDDGRMIEIIDYEQDAGKSMAEIHRRIYNTIKQQKRAIMIEKAFSRIANEARQEENDFALEFSLENLDKIRRDAAYVQERLMVCNG